MVHLTVTMVGDANGALLDTMVPVSNGMFTYNFMQSGLAVGDYTASGGDFGLNGCEFDAPFHVQ
jgi:hypothetical protein